MKKLLENSLVQGFLSKLHSFSEFPNKIFMKSHEIPSESKREDLPEKLPKNQNPKMYLFNLASLRFLQKVGDKIFIGKSI